MHSPVGVPREDGPLPVTLGPFFSVHSTVFFYIPIGFMRAHETDPSLLMQETNGKEWRGELMRGGEGRCKGL